MGALTWVLDTWVLAVTNPSSERCLEAAAFLHSISRSHCIALDQEGAIVREYERYLRVSEMAMQWWRRMMSTGRIEWHHGHLSERHYNTLVGSLSFDRSDIKFVAVASRTADRLLVAEESDYSAPVKDYLGNHLNVSVLSLSEADIRARDP